MCLSVCMSTNIFFITCILSVNESTTLLFLCFLKIVRIKENKWSILTFHGILIVSIRKQIECILNDIRVYEHNQNNIENRNLIPLTTSCCDRFLASSAHIYDQRLYVPLWYPIPIFPECVKQFLPRAGWVFPFANSAPKLVPKVLYWTLLKGWPWLHWYTFVIEVVRNHIGGLRSSDIVLKNPKIRMLLDERSSVRLEDIRNIVKFPSST